jgi:hypothetical protein
VLSSWSAFEIQSQVLMKVLIVPAGTRRPEMTTKRSAAITNLPRHSCFRLWMHRSTCARRLGDIGVLRLIFAPFDSIAAPNCEVSFVSLSRITNSGARFRSSASITKSLSPDATPAHGFHPASAAGRACVRASPSFRCEPPLLRGPNAGTTGR